MTQGASTRQGGRAKGTPNATKQAIRDTLANAGYEDPVIALARMAQAAEENTDEPGNKALAVSCYKEIAKYVHPTLKAVEATVEIPDGVEVRSITRTLVAP